jgi:hypothetical protein
METCNNDSAGAVGQAIALLLQHWGCRVQVCNNIDHCFVEPSWLGRYIVLNSLCFYHFAACTVRYSNHGAVAYTALQNALSLIVCCCLQHKGCITYVATHKPDSPAEHSLQAVPAYGTNSWSWLDTHSGAVTCWRLPHNNGQARPIQHQHQTHHNQNSSHKSKQLGLTQMSARFLQHMHAC